MKNRVSFLFISFIISAFFFSGCSKEREIWRYDLGETLKVQTIPLALPEKGLVVTWKIIITADDEAEGRYVIPRVRTVKPGIALELEKKRFQAALVGLDEESGEERWVSPPLGESDQNLSSPVAFDDKIYVGSDNGFLYEIDAGSGEILWSYKTEGWIYASPTVSREYIVAGNENGTLFCWARENKELLFQKELPGSVDFPWIIDGNRLFGAAGNTLFLYSTRGEFLNKWQSSDKYTDYDGFEKKNAPVVSALFYDGKQAAFVTQGEYLHLFDVEKWESLQRFYASGMTGARPLIYETSLIAGSPEGVLVFDKESRNLKTILKTDHRWMDFNLKFRRGGAVNGGFLLHNGILYFGSYDYALYGYDIRSLKRIFKFAIQHHIDRTIPVMGKKYLIFGADSHHLYAVSPYEP
ncbi:MAG TPA: hypothetical protein ENN72_01160 [Firmicutes bacterium]|nr:hypothetical protein [Bacillota bacterium]